MAKNYSLAEAVQIIVENEDAAQITELGKRFPLLVSKITFIAAKAGKELDDLMQFMPDNLSANKVNMSIKKALEADGDEEVDDEDFEDDGDDVEEEAPAKKSGKGEKSVKKKASKGDGEEIDTSDTDYDSWNNAKMYKLLGEMGKRKDCKDKFGDLSHDSMLKYLKKYGPGMEEAADDADAEVEDEEQVDYEGMKAVDLYKLCKERKIKAEKQKPAKYYVSLLKKADEAEAEDESDDEDWDDEEAEEEVEEKKAPASKAKGGKSSKVVEMPKNKGGKKSAKEADDDEDWDI